MTMKKAHFTRRRPVPAAPAAPAPTLQERFSIISRQMISQVLDFDENPREHTICFTGHRKLDSQESKAIAAQLDELLPVCYRKGYHMFLTGGALGFDMLAAEAVFRLRATYPDAKLGVVIPCADQSCRWSTKDCHRYERILLGADKISVLSRSYYEGCMMIRNRHMVDHSALCLCYLNKFKGGTASTVAYASRMKVPILNVAMQDACAAYIASEK